MLETYCRHHYQRLFVNWPANIIANINFISANIISGLACLTGIATWPLMAYQHHWLAIIFLWISGYLDTLDGTVARISHENSRNGAILDIIGDRVVEICVILGLQSINPDQRSFLCLLMLAGILLCVTTFLITGIFNQQKNTKGFYYSSGLIERAEAFIFFTLMMIMPTVFKPLAIIFFILVLYTASIRILSFINS